MLETQILNTGEGRKEKTHLKLCGCLDKQTRSSDQNPKREGGKQLMHHNGAEWREKKGWQLSQPGYLKNKIK